MNSELRKRFERCRKLGEVTENGVVYDWELAGPSGAAYELFREPRHTDQDIAEADKHLRAHHDVVTMRVTRISQDELSTPLEPEKPTIRRIPSSETRPFCTVLAVHIDRQKIYFQGKSWIAGQDGLSRLSENDVGKRVVLTSTDSIEIESDEHLVERTAEFTEFPRGGDAVRLVGVWEWALRAVQSGSWMARPTNIWSRSPSSLIPYRFSTILTVRLPEGREPYARL
jgi:hypothetical protein